MVQPFVLGENEGTMLMNGIPHLVKAGEIALRRSVAAFTCDIAAGEEPPLHVHTTEDEVFFVLEGRLEFTCNGTPLDAAPRSFVFLPCGLPHTFRVVEGPAKLLVLTFPAAEHPQGWGGYIGSIESDGDFTKSTPPA